MRDRRKARKMCGTRKRKAAKRRFGYPARRKRAFKLFPGKTQKNPRVCDCDMQALMLSGCKCGGA